MRLFSAAVCLTLACMISATTVADEKPKGKGNARAKAPTPTQRMLTDIELTAEQKEKVAAVDKEFQERFTALAKQRSDILTAEQKTAQRDATKAAKEAGKTPAETRKAVQEALMLSEDQQAKMKEVQKSQNELNAKIREALTPILTAEQQEKLPKAPTPRNTGKGRKKKEAAAEQQ